MIIAMDAKGWVKMWMATGERLESIRLKELRTVNTASGIESFAGLETEAIRAYPPKPTSGLIEFQKLLQRLK